MASRQKKQPDSSSPRTAPGTEEPDKGTSAAQGEPDRRDETSDAAEAPLPAEPAAQADAATRHEFDHPGEGGDAGTGLDEAAEELRRLDTADAEARDEAARLEEADAGDRLFSREGDDETREESDETAETGVDVGEADDRPLFGDERELSGDDEAAEPPPAEPYAAEAFGTGAAASAAAATTTSGEDERGGSEPSPPAGYRPGDEERRVRGARAVLALLAGVVLGAFAALLAYEIVTIPGLDRTALGLGPAADEHLGERLAALEQKVDAAEGVGGAARIGARLTALETDVSDLQTAVKSAIAGTGRIPALESRLGEVEQRLGTVAGQLTALDDRLGTTGERVGALAKEVGGIDDRIAAAIKNAPFASADAVTTLRARLTAIDQTLASGPFAQKDSLDRLGQRVAALASALDTTQASETATGQKVGSLASDVGGLQQTLASLQGKAEAQTAQTAALEAKISALEAELARRNAREVAALAVISASLQRALDDGRPFAMELDAVKSAVDAPDLVATLTPFAESGLPVRSALATRFADVAARMRAAVGGGAQAGEHGLLGGFLSGAQGLVSVERTGAAEGKSLDATLERIRSAIESGDFAAVPEAWNALPAKAQAAGEDWIGAVRARLAARRLVDTLNEAVIAALAQPVPAAGGKASGTAPASGGRSGTGDGGGSPSGAAPAAGDG